MRSSFVRVLAIGDSFDVFFARPVRANLAEDLPAHQKMTHDEVVAQLTTFRSSPFSGAKLRSLADLTGRQYLRAMRQAQRA